MIDNGERGGERGGGRGRDGEATMWELNEHWAQSGLDWIRLDWRWPERAGLDWTD